MAAFQLRAPGQPEALRDEVVATVDGEPVYVRDLEPHLRPEAPWTGQTPPVDPVDSALRDAIIIRLLVAEAKRQGFEADPGGERSIVDGQLVQALLSAELANRGFRPASVTEADAKAFFDDNRTRLSRFGGATVSAIVVNDPEKARQLLRSVASATDAEFRALVDQHSIDDGSRAEGGFVAEIDAEAGNVPLEVARVAVSLRRDGGFGLAETGDGRLWVVRVTDVRLGVPDWNEAMEQRVRQLMEVDEQAAVIAELESRLRPASDVEIFGSVVDRFRSEMAAPESTSIPRPNRT